MPYEDLVYSRRTTRIYLDELGEIESLPIGIALMVLTTIDEAEAPQVARDLLQRSEVQDSTPVISRAIIEMVSIIMTYKFITMNRQEVEAMLDITIRAGIFANGLRENKTPVTIDRGFELNGLKPNLRSVVPSCPLQEAQGSSLRRRPS